MSHPGSGDAPCLPGGEPGEDLDLSVRRPWWTASVSGPTLRRRTFLVRAGTAAATLAGGLALASCSSRPDTAGAGRRRDTHRGRSPHEQSTTSTTLAAHVVEELHVSSMVASLEVLAAYAYGQGLVATKAGTLGIPLPPAVPVLLETAHDHHQDHADAWNDALQLAGEPRVTTADPVLLPSVRRSLAGLTSLDQLLELVLNLENTIAQTYQAAMATLTSTAAVGRAATTLPVEMQHAATLYLLLGRYPGLQTTTGRALAFTPTTLSRPVSDYPGSA